MEHVDVLIVGAGLSGIGAACHLRREHPDKSFTILEGRERLGGTWDLFRYPGIRSDSDMFTFGFAFKPWVEDQDIATGDAILRYLDETVRENDLDEKIRYRHRVIDVAWNTPDRRWVATVRREEDESTFLISCDFLLTCTGYYNYEHGHLPKFEGFDDFEGVVAHPQHWPEDLDYRGKRVLVIGSGATAVTIVPSMAGEAEHVTMLQRSPTYIFSRPAEDAIAKKLRETLPSKLAYRLSRIKNVTMGTFMYKLARRKPEMIRGHLRKMAIDALGEDFDVDVHFKPSYDPWDQRLCLIPDDDLYAAIRDGGASVVTDHIDHFDANGVVLSSGERIDADIVVPATGLELQFGGGMSMHVDGESIEPGDLISYRGMMFGNVPNWVAVIGYTSASWTLKADLTSEFVCRVLHQMDDGGYDMVVPRLSEGELPTRPIMANLKSGYVKRAANRMPQQGLAFPWTNGDSYPADYLRMKLGRLDDGVLEFSRQGAIKKRGRFSYAGKTALVTGAASGIGEALALDLASRGTHLVLADVQAAELERVAQAARRRGVTVSSFVVDLGDEQAREGFVAEVLDLGQPIDLLINNAGVALGGNVEQVSGEELEWLMRINFFAVAHLSRAFLPMMQTRPDAHIANVSSVFGLIAPPGQAAYCASKFAVRGFSEALRRELKGSTVGVSLIHPGGIKTSIARNARVAQAVDRENLQAEIAEMEKAFITTPENAAKEILAGIEKRKARILVGPDARLVEALERIFPTRNVEMIMRLLGWKQPEAVSKPVDAAADEPLPTETPSALVN